MNFFNHPYSSKVLLIALVVPDIMIYLTPLNLYAAFPSPLPPPKSGIITSPPFCVFGLSSSFEKPPDIPFKPVLPIDYGIHCPKKASWELKTYMMQKDIMNILRLPNNKNNKCPNCICSLDTYCGSLYLR